MFRGYDYRFIQAIRKELAEMGIIALFWDVGDVQQVAPELTDEQAFEVLQRVEEDHNAQYGVSFDTLADTALQMFPEVLE